MSEQDPKRPHTPGEEPRPAVYMVPHPKLKEQEIQVTDLVLPTLRYKWQVITVVLVVLLLGIFISLRYGETLYTDWVEYHYQIPPTFRPEPVLKELILRDESLEFKNNVELQAAFPYSFFPDQKLLQPEALLAARSILEKHFPIPRKAAAEQLSQMFEDSLYLDFEPCEKCKYGIRLNVTTTDPKATHQALLELDQFFMEHNAQLNIQHFSGLAEQIRHKMDSAAAQRLAQIELAPQIWFSRIQGKEVFALESGGQNYLMEHTPKDNGPGTWRLIHYRNLKELGTHRESVSSRVRRLKRSGSNLTEQTAKAYQVFFKSHQAYLEAALAYEAAQKQLTAARRSQDPKAIAQAESVESTANQRLVRLKTAQEQQAFPAAYLMKRLEAATEQQALMAGYPFGDWIEIAQETAPATLSVVNNENLRVQPDFHQQLDFWVKDLLRLEELEQSYRLRLVNPIKLVKGPSLDTVAVSYRLNFKRSSAQPGEAKPLSYEDFRDITFSKKILALFLLAGGVLAVLSAMGRAYLSRAAAEGKTSRLTQQLKEALKDLRP